MPKKRARVEEKAKHYTLGSGKALCSSEKPPEPIPSKILLAELMNHSNVKGHHDRMLSIEKPVMRGMSATANRCAALVRTGGREVAAARVGAKPGDVRLDRARLATLVGTADGDRNAAGIVHALIRRAVRAAKFHLVPVKRRNDTVRHLDDQAAETNKVDAPAHRPERRRKNAVIRDDRNANFRLLLHEQPARYRPRARTSGELPHDRAR